MKLRRLVFHPDGSDCPLMKPCAPGAFPARVDGVNLNKLPQPVYRTLADDQNVFRGCGFPHLQYGR